jgi:hypothetical protein
MKQLKHPTVSKYMFQMYFDNNDGGTPAIRHEVPMGHPESSAYRSAQLAFRAHAEKQRPFRGWSFRRIDEVVGADADETA